MKNREILQSQFQKIARAMSQNWGITVVPAGLACSTNGKVINFPFNADFLADATKKTLHGILDHEVGHVAEEKAHKEAKKRTPLAIMNNVVKSNKEGMLLNVFEDIRIENKYSKQYIGVAENLHEASLHAAGVISKRLNDKRQKTDFWQIFGSAIIFKARGYDVPWLPKEYKPFLDSVQEEIDDCPKMKWGDDAHALALRVLSKVEDEASKLEEELNKRGNAGEDGEEKGNCDENCGGNSNENGEKSQNDGGANADADGGEEDGEDGESSAGGEGESTDGEDETEASSETGASGKATPAGFASDEMSDTEITEIIQKMSQDSKVKDLMDQVKDQVNKEAAGDARNNERYIPNPLVLKKDRWFKEKNDNSPESIAKYNQTKQAVSGQIRGLKGKLMNVVKAKAISRMEGGHKRGRLDKSRLPQIVAGNTHIFQQEIEGETLDTAIMVLFDFSGSMGSGDCTYDKAYYARHMGVALAETFDPLGTPFEMIGFTNYGGRVLEVVGTRRVEPLNYHILKTFDEKYSRVKYRMNTITGHGNNTDGEAVWAVANRLAQRPEQRKILIVISDGMPRGGGENSYVLENHLIEVVKKVTSVGIEVLSIGVQTDSVKKYYNKDTGAECIVVNKLNQLAVETYKAMRALILKRKRRTA